MVESEIYELKSPSIMEKKIKGEGEGWRRRWQENAKSCEMVALVTLRDP